MGEGGGEGEWGREGGREGGKGRRFGKCNEGEYVQREMETGRKEVGVCEAGMRGRGRGRGTYKRTPLLLCCKDMTVT